MKASSESEKKKNTNIEDNQLTVYTRRREELNGAWEPDARWLQGAGKTPLDYYAIDLFEGLTLAITLV